MKNLTEQLDGFGMPLGEVEALTPFTKKFPKQISAQDVVNYYLMTEPGIDRDWHMNNFKNKGYDKWVLKSIPVKDIESHRLSKDSDSDKRIGKYAAQKTSGSKFPPLILVPNKFGGSKYMTYDGHHRFEAAKKSGARVVPAYIPLE